MLRGLAVVKKRGKRTGKVTARNPVKRRSSAAAALASAGYRQRVVRSAKIYRRKGRRLFGPEDDE